MPTTMNVSGAGCVTWLVVRAGTSAPEIAVNFTWVPTAPAGDLKPSATASLSVRRSSVALSDLGMRPAVTVGTPPEEPTGARHLHPPPASPPGPALPPHPP